MWNEREKKRLIKILQEKLALHIGVSAFDESILEQLFYCNT